jgi:PAP2 superfamily
VRKWCVVLLIPALTWTLPAEADVVGDVHDLALRTAIADGKAPAAAGTLTIVDLAMFDAANAIERRYEPYRPQPSPPAGADANAAALGAGCAALAALHPAQQAATGKACDAIIATLPAGGAGVNEGRKFGESVGTAQVMARRGDGPGAPNHYRPFTAPGVYVPTALPIGFDAVTAKPYALNSPSQFRPGPPPALTSEAWARDYNEVKALGGRTSAARTPAQTATALFWASNGAQQYLDSVSGLPPIPSTGVTDRARFLALLFMAISDASVAHFDAKYAYNFWRPVTAIRNGDLDGNDATERDAGWLPFVDTPLHPEYPCAHCNVAAAIATVVTYYLGEGELQVPFTVKPATAAGRTTPSRSWKRVADFVPEVADARVWGGLHYRNSTAAGIALGDAVGRWVVTTQLRPLPATR